MKVLTLQTTALVNEAYLRLADCRHMQWQQRAHFFAVAAQLMRRILVEHARARQSEKRGGGALKVAFDETVAPVDEFARELLAFDEALTKLEALERRKSQVVELRCFGGLSNEEIAAVLHVSPNTVMRDWNFAKAWLKRELGLTP
jgi:RNA polymerase sigma-70 factor (ECF subfamily)